MSDLPPCGRADRVAVMQGCLCFRHVVLLAGTEESPKVSDWGLFRVCSGAGYLMTNGRVCELSEGDIIIVSHASRFALRASQINGLRLCGFDLQPQNFLGVLSLVEQQTLSSLASDPDLAPRVISASEAGARQFTRLCALRRQGNELVLRGEMLLVALRVLSETICHGAGSAEPPARGSEQRFEELMRSLTGAEIAAKPLRELARACGCSERHFRRLFQRRFGASFQRRRTQLRIDMAKRRLAETEAKVIDIALQSGFKSLSLFNATFKRVARMTPSQWRALQARNLAVGKAAARRGCFQGRC